MKTNIKMRVTPEQSKRVQEICFKNNIAWHGVKAFNHLRQPYIYVYENTLGYDCKESSEYFNDHENIEIDADLFIRTNGTCEENTFNELFEKVRERVNDFQLKDFIQSQNENIDRVNDWVKQFNDVSLKLKKKNEILKKARIKRKNQREELNKLNLKLQKYISLEDHNIRTEKLRDTIVSLRDDVINKVDNITYNKNKEIEKLKAVIEYLESKVK